MIAKSKEENMKRSTQCIKKIVALLLLISILLGTLTGCIVSREPATKDEIAASVSATVENDSYGYDYVLYYLRQWRLPDFDTTKLFWAENVFKNYYVYNGGLPETLEHAAMTAEYFVENYYDNIDMTSKTAVTDAVIDSYVRTVGDPFSYYRTPQEASDFNSDMSGKFGGIGVLVEYNYDEKTILISNVYQNSPAEAAGILEGDYIYAVDGKTVDELGLENAVNHVRGEIGTYVELTLKRGDELVVISVMRDTIEEINASYEFDEETGLGYIKIVSFKDNTFDQFKASVDALEALGAKGIVFDVRNNPGGYLYSVVDVISYLIPTGYKVVSFRYKNSDPEQMASKDDGGVDHTLEIPFVVLCNEYTASAGEIFTSALRDYAAYGLLKGKTVGVTTFGKGIMQNTFAYPLDGSSVTMTVAYYDPPCGVNYHDIGIEPDVKVELGDEGDNQLEAAYETLKNLINEN